MASFTTLYSGSSGNCGLVQCGQKYLLIDMGKSCRITLNALKELGLALSDLEGILVTHEHSDHIKGLQVFLKNHPVPLYAGADTLDALDAMGVLPAGLETQAVEGRTLDVGGFEVTAFPTSHDVPCCGYRIHTPDGRVMAIATDLGQLTTPVHQNLSGADLVALEANYDPYSLRNGPYPYYLKQRIASARGHLSNDECAAKILELLQEGCTRFALCHLSQENNTPDLALGTVFRTLAMAGCTPEKGTIIQAQKRSQISDNILF